MDINRIFKRIRKDIDNKKVWLSLEMKRYLETKVWAVCTDFFKPTLGLTITYEDGEESPTACTDSRSIMINVGNPMFTDTDKGTHLLNVLGALFHELGHYLFTNFTLKAKAYDALSSGTFFPKEPTFTDIKMELNKQKLLDILKDSSKASIIILILQNLRNALEDGRIEDMLFRYVKNARYMIKGLHSVRNYFFEHSPEFKELLSKMADEKMYEFEAIICMAGYYARFRDIKGFDSVYEKEALFQRFEELMPLLDKYIESETGAESFDALNIILISLSDDIEKYLKDIESRLQQQGNKSSSSQNNASSAQNNGNSAFESSSSPSMAEIEKEIQKRLSEIIPNQTTDNSSNMSGNLGSDDVGVKAAIKAQQTQEQQNNSSYQGGSGTISPGSSDSDENKQGDENSLVKIARTQTSTITTPGSGKIDYDISKVSSNLKTDFSKILNQLVENEVENEVNSSIKEEYSNLALSNDFGRIHRNADITFYRYSPTSSDKEAYDELLKEQRKSIREMVRKSDFYEKDRQNLMVKNQLFGTKFNAKDAYNPNLKHFSKNRNVDNPPNLAVSLVIDESGSMNGIREIAARRMAQMVYEYCESLSDQNNIQIPLGIYGHTAHAGHSKIFIYADPNNPSPEDKYRLMSISSRNCNRDGLAIRIALKRLEEDFPSSQKLFIVVTDGQPNDEGYRGTAAEADLHDIAEYCEKNHIGLVVAAIGSDKNNIRRIYGEKHFVDITDLDALPKAMVRRIKKVLE